MERLVLFLGLLVATTAAHVTPGMAQTELTIPGGATGADVFCIQAGDLTSGKFVETFLQTDGGAWEQHSKAHTIEFAEKARDDLIVDLFDESRSTAVQFDFVTMTIREKPDGGAWTDRFVILNATDQAKSKDCVSLAAIDGESSGNSSTKAAEPSNEPAKAKAPSKPNTKTKTTATPRTKAKTKTTAKPRPTPKATSKRVETRKKKRLLPGLSVGVGGLGLRF
ncbi:MAG TPA: hypothetical protein VMW68_08415 [Methyloceanibacter sp.]|nr:hypothetical protein [Methyloceanibacter sp.]